MDTNYRVENPGFGADACGAVRALSSGPAELHGPAELNRPSELHVPDAPHRPGDEPRFSRFTQQPGDLGSS